MEGQDASYAVSVDVDGGICALSYEELNSAQIIKSVGDDAAGAIAVFIGTYSAASDRKNYEHCVGTTRNSFGGRFALGKSHLIT